VGDEKQNMRGRMEISVGFLTGPLRISDRDLYKSEGMSSTNTRTFHQQE
jgi:hypothetical protein